MRPSGFRRARRARKRDGFLVNADLLRNRAAQSCGIQRGAGGEDALRCPVQRVLDVMRDNVRRIGDIDDNAVKTGFFDGFCYIFQDGDGLTQRIHTGLIAGRSGPAEMIIICASLASL